MKGQWSEDKSVVANVHYSLDNDKSLVVTVETPFQGWEKQDLTFTITMKDYEINVHGSATWRNAEQVKLIISGKLLPAGLATNQFNTQVSLTSTSDMFENISFKMDHEMVDATTINTSVEGIWNDSVMNGMFQLTPNDNGFDGRASLTGLLTEEILVTFHHEFVNMELSTVLEAKYGTQVSTLTLTGHIDVGDANLVLKLMTPTTTVIDGNMKYTNNGNNLVLVAEGTVAEQKVMLNINGTKTVTDDTTTTVTGDIRFITPLTYPLTATLSHKHNGESFTSDVEISRIWSQLGYGDVKIHVQGHMASKQDITLIGHIQSPATKASISINHKIVDNNISSVVDVSINGQGINISVDGTLNNEYTLAKLHAQVTSTFNQLNDIKVDIDVEKIDNVWSSKIILMKDTMSVVTIDHSINYTNLFNWENQFIVNNIYQLNNKMTHVDTSYQHQLDYKWESQLVHLKFFIDPKFVDNFHQIDAQLEVVTPWTENIKIDLHHQHDGVEYKPTLLIEYKPASVIEIASVFKIEPSTFYNEITLTTPFWQPLGYKLNVQQQAITLDLTRGPNKTTIDVSGQYEDWSKMNGHLEVHSTYLQTPIVIEVENDFKSPEKMVHLVVKTDKTFDIKGVVSGSLEEAKWSLTTDLPLSQVQHVELSGEYHILALPFSVNTMFMLNTDKYEFNSVINSKEILIDMDISGQKGQLSGKWNMEEIHGNIDVSFQSPVSSVENMDINLMYDIETDKKLNIKWNNGAAEVDFVGMLVDPLTPKLTLTIITPFNTVKTLGGEVEWNVKDSVKTAQVKTYLNDDHYDWQLQAATEGYDKGYATSKITTTLPGWTDVAVEGNFDFSAKPYKVVFKYNKEGDVKTFEGHLNIDQNAITGEIITPIPGWENISVSGDYTYENNNFISNVEFVHGGDSYKAHTDILFSGQPKMEIIINTPIVEVATVTLKLDSLMDQTKTHFLITFQLNNNIYSADFLLELHHKTGLMKVLVKSPIPEYTQVELLTNYDFTGDVKTAEMHLNIEEEKQHFSVSTQVNDNNVHLNILTPIEGFEDIKMIGDYSVIDGQYKLVASMEKASEKYDLQADFSLVNKEFNLKLSTPILVIKNIIVGLKVNILDHGIDGLLHIERNEDKFEVSTHGDFTPIKSNLHLEVITPVDGWKTLLLDVNYDFLSDIKIVEMSLHKNTIIYYIKGEASYNTESGSFKLETPVPGFEVLGAQYLLKMDQNVLDANIMIKKNDQEWSFSVHGQYSSDNIKIELKTPFNIIKFISASVTYSWTDSKKEATVNVAYNEKSYALTCLLDSSLSKSEFSLQGVTPFHNYENVSLVVKYDINNRDELASIHLTAGDQMYKFLMLGYIEEQEAYLQWDLTTPIVGWTKVKFIAHVDLKHQDKMLEISLERDENVKAIVISGKIVGSSVDFNLKTPFSGLHLFNLSAALDRNKRSLELQMLSDVAQASILTSFNSLKIHLKTPFEQAEEIKWEITKLSESSYKGEWRRNDNYLVISVEKQGTNNAFNIDVESQLQGWELMALAGQLDQQTLQGYLSGNNNEEKILITGSASFSEVGELHLNIKTPSEYYKNVDVNMEYNVKERSFKVEASSTTSDFHYILSFTVTQGIHMHLLVPNSQENTEVTINWGLYSGEAIITSRFSFLRNFHEKYEVNVDPGHLKVHYNMKYNDQEIINLDLTGDYPNKKAQLEIRTFINNASTTIYYQHQAYSSLTLVLRRQVDSTDKQIRVDVSGSEDLPSRGTLDIVMTNTFWQTPVTRRSRVYIDTVSDNKEIIVEITPQASKLYKAELRYRYTNRTGEFSLRTTTPNKKMSPWKNISGNWNMETLEQAHFEVSFGEQTYIVEGKLSPYESDLILNLGPTATENVLLHYRFLHNDYFIKIGKESNYGMIKLKGMFQDLAHVNFEGSFRAGSLMDNDFNFTCKWNMASNGIFTSEGTFNFGQYRGKYNLEEFIRNAATRSATFAWKATSNIDNFDSLSLAGNYDFNNKIVIFGLIKINDQESRIDVNLADVYPDHSNNTIEFNFPALGPSYRTMIFTINHDFRNLANKSFSAIAKIGEREYYAKASWSRSEHFDQLTGNMEMKTILLGDIHITMDYNISNINDAQVEVKYSRTPANNNNQQKFVNMKWIRKMTSDNFQSELTLDSTLRVLSHLKVYGNADYSNNFHISSGIEWNNKIITFSFHMTEDGLSAQLTTPFQHFESIDATATYSLGGKTKKITVDYTRGNNKVTMELTLNAKSMKKGNMTLMLTTPFELLRFLNITANWKNKVAQVNIQRNDDQYIIEGTVDLKINKSSFDVVLTIPQWQTIRIAASYNVQKFLAGSGTDKERLASLHLEFEGKTVDFNLEGFRNSNELTLEMDGNTSFEQLRAFHFKLDYEFSHETYEGDFEMVLNDFEFKTENKYEKRGNDGYYIKTKIETTLTPLPALIIGIGRNGGERMVTIGYGEDREITFTIQGKNNYNDGFFGTFDIPNYGYDGVHYDVSYGFNGNDELLVHITTDLGQNGDKVELELSYNSEGVRGRLMSPWTGRHNMRVRRSVSQDGFSTEASYNDYTLSLRGGFKEGDTKHGAILEGDVFGNKFLIDYLLQSEGPEYTEGKLFIETPFTGMEKMGGLFTVSNVDKKIDAHAQVLLPSYTTPKIIGHINLDLNDKLDGIVSLDIAGQKFSLKTHLVGTSLTEGYQGTIELQTPFLVLQSFVADLTIKVVPWTLAQVKATVNNNQVKAEYTIAESTFKFNLDTLIETVHRQVSLEAKYPSVDNLEGTVIIVTAEDSHKLHLLYNIVNNHIQGELDLESTIIDVPLKLNYNISIPNVSLDLVNFEVTLTTSETYSFYFEVDRTADFITIVKLESPSLSKITGTLQVSLGSAKLMVETVDGNHEALVSWRLTESLPLDYMASLELESYLLPQKYDGSISLYVNKNNMKLKSEVHVGPETHVFDGSIVSTETTGQLKVKLETPYIGLVDLDASLNFGENIEMHITASYNDNVNTLDVSYDRVNHKFMALVNSPLIPTGQASAQAVITGDVNTNIKMNLDLNYAGHVISGLLNIKMLSSDDMSAIFKVTTPFVGYNKMNFVARYLKDQQTHLLISLDRPVKFNVELHLSNQQDQIMAELVLETPIKNFEMVHAKMDIPLNVFGPCITLDLDLEGVSYGGNFGLRTKAPYELALGLHMDNTKAKFHLRTDSSFLTLLS